MLHQVYTMDAAAMGRRGLPKHFFTRPRGGESRLAAGPGEWPAARRVLVLGDSSAELLEFGILILQKGVNDWNSSAIE